VWQQVFLLARRHHVTVHVVSADGQLSSRGGVAAVLSRRDPW
jgi:hypothetical protein